MKKNRITAALLAGLILTSLAGCGSKQTAPSAADTAIAETVGSTADVPSAADISDDIPADTTESEVSKGTTAEKEEENKPTEPTTPPAASAPADSTEKPPQTATPTENPPKATESAAPPKETGKPTEQPTAKPTKPPVTEPAETTPPESKPVVTKPTEPAEPQPPAETEPQGFTTADHDRIIAEVKAYAEGYTAKGYTYIWKADMEFSEDIGYMGTPRIARDGVDGVIRILKHHIDLIYKTTTDPANGITCDEMTYRVMQIDLDGEIAFAVVYGG